MSHFLAFLHNDLFDFIITVRFYEELFPPPIGPPTGSSTSAATFMNFVGHADTDPKICMRSRTQIEEAPI
jgi:hypothetical protein